jgi:hypothetical protein
MSSMRLVLPPPTLISISPTKIGLLDRYGHVFAEMPATQRKRGRPPNSRSWAKDPVNVTAVLLAQCIDLWLIGMLEVRIGDQWQQAPPGSRWPPPPLIKHVLCRCAIEDARRRLGYELRDPEIVDARGVRRIDKGSVASQVAAKVTRLAAARRWRDARAVATARTKSASS